MDSEPQENILENKVGLVDLRTADEQKCLNSYL